jgi:hypothetical protein
MKRILLAALFLGSLASACFAQETKTYDKYLVKETNPAVLKYADPTFPSEPIVIGQPNPKMEEYAKLHPPFTLKKNTGDASYDQAKFDSDVAYWLILNPYYPQFVPYHLFNALLTPDDDIAIYETAKAAWIKANPLKYQDIQNSSK